MSEELPWDKIDRTKEPGELAFEAMEKRKKREFELTTIRNAIEKFPDLEVSAWWEKTCPGYHGGLWCTFYYAVSVGATMRNSVVLGHAPQHCTAAARTFFWQFVENLYWGTPFRFMPTTDLDERDAILGAPDKLRKAILEVDKIYKPELIIVAEGCIPGMTGEPMEDLVADVKPQINAEIIHIPSPGFLTPDEGTMITRCSENVWTQLMKEPEKKDEGGVNITGDYRDTTWWEKYRVRGNFPSTADEANDIFKAMGLHLHAAIPSSSLEELHRAPEAELNTVICPMWGYPICREMEEKFGVPYSYHAMPVGIDSVSRWIMGVAEHFDKEKEAEEYIAKKTKELEPLYDEAKKLVEGKTILADSAISMTSVGRQLMYGRCFKELDPADIIFYNISPPEIVGRREWAGYTIAEPVKIWRGEEETFEPKYLFWPAPYSIKINPIDVIDFLGIKPSEVIWYYGDFAWYAKAPIVDASNMPSVQSAVHQRRHRNSNTRSCFFSGTKAFVRDIVNSVRTLREGKWTLYSRILGQWKVPGE